MILAALQLLLLSAASFKSGDYDYRKKVTDVQNEERWATQGEDEADFLLRDGAQWDPKRGLCLFLKWFKQSSMHWDYGSNDVQARLFRKSVENEDITILKYIIDSSEHGENSLDCTSLLKKYFVEYRLSQADVDEELRRAVVTLPSRYFDDQLVRMLSLLFSDYPNSHPFLPTSFTLVPLLPIKYNYILLHSFLTVAASEAGHRFRLPYEPPIDHLVLIRKLFNKFNLSTKELLRYASLDTKLLWSLIDMENERDDKLLQRLFDRRAWSVEDTSISISEFDYSVNAQLLCYIYDRWPEWVLERVKDIEYPYLLAFAWKRPSMAHLVRLPTMMPDITLLVPPSEHYSFEKAPFFDHILRKYGTDAILGAMAAKISIFTGMNFYLVKVMANPHGDFDRTLMLKCLPEGPEELDIWVRWMMLVHNFEPNPRVLEQIVILCNTRKVSQLPWPEILAIMFPSLM